MPRKGTIYVETRNETFRHDDMAQYGLKPGRYVTISIRDTGSGMDEKTKERVFEPFFTTREMKRGGGAGPCRCVRDREGARGWAAVKPSTR
jgi:signal transduction histidine kinase